LYRPLIKAGLLERLSWTGQRASPEGGLLAAQVDDSGSATARISRGWAWTVEAVLLSTSSDTGDAIDSWTATCCLACIAPSLLLYSATVGAKAYHLTPKAPFSLLLLEGVSCPSGFSQSGSPAYWHAALFKRGVVGSYLLTYLLGALGKASETEEKKVLCVELSEAQSFSSTSHQARTELI
jgi:hypothetical protein